MPITVIVRTVGDDGVRLTFDGTQRVVIGRGAGSDVRLPDSSVSHRHATIRAQGSEFVLVDEGSTNGTFVGGVRIAAHTSRLVRSHDQVRLGRIWLELRLEQSPVTRDLAAATRDLALALVSQAIAAVGGDTTTRVRVVEGADQGSVILLAEGDRDYVLGRGPQCDLLLADADVSREHLRLVRRNGAVFVCDLGTRNGTQIGDARAPRGEPVLWRPAQMIKVGQTVLALEEPVMQALALIEKSADEPFALAAAPAGLAPPSEAAILGGEFGPEGATSPQEAANAEPSTPSSTGVQSPRRAGWSATDLVVMTAAVGVLVLSLAGLVWLIRG
jgi:pSer/pThr/pTyr-binding forkhead associated (FHA) protein